MRNFYFILFLAGSINVFSQDPAAIYYTTRDGLISNNVYYVMQDSKGYLWICTDKGVSRFDGKNFRNFGKAEGLDGRSVFICYEDYMGRIWFGSYSNEIKYYHRGHIHDYKYNEKIIDHFSYNCVKTSIHMDNNNTFSLGTLRLGYIRINQNGDVANKKHSPGKNLVIEKEFEINYSTRSNQPPHANSIGISVSENGETFSHIGDTSQENLKRKPNFYSQKRWLDSSFFISSHNVLYSFKNQKIKYLAAFDHPIDCIYFDSQENLVLGFIGNGIRIYIGGDTKKEPNVYFENMSVTSITQDKNSNFYLGSLGEGLIKVPDFKLYKYSPNDLTIATVKHVNDSIVYVGCTNGSIFKFNKTNKRFSKVFEIEENRTDLPIHFGYNYTSEQLIISSQFHNPRYKENVIYQNMKKQNYDLRFFISNNTNSYAASNVKLFRIDNAQNPKIWDFLDIDSEFRINSLALEDQGLIWIGSNKGLFTLKDSILNKVPGFDTEIKKVVLYHDHCYVHVFGKGIFAISKADTILIKKDLNTIKDFGRVLNTDYTYYLEGHRLSVLNPNGLKDVNVSRSMIVPFESIKYISHEKDEAWLIDNFSIYCFKNYLFNNKGISIYPPVVEKVKVNDEYLFSEHNNISIEENESNEIEFYINTIKSGKFESLLYFYKLEPIHNEWIHSTTPQLNFNALEAGEYRLLVKSSRFGVAEGRSSSFRIIVTEPQKITAINVFILFFSSFLFFYSYIQYNSYRKKRMKIEFERLREMNILKLKALFAQMNPHFTFNVLNSLQGLVLKDQRIKSIYYLNKYARLLRKVLNNSNNPVLELREEFELLSRYVEMENLRFKNRISLKIDENKNEEVKNYSIPAMLLQPIVENSIKHGLNGNEKLKVLIDIKTNNHFLLIDIIDDGVGYSISRKKSKNQENTSFGLTIVSERLKILNQEHGNLDYYFITDVVKNEEIIGTKVSIKFPIVKEETINENKRGHNR